MAALRVIHVLRAPVGGLFRHVRDLVGAQAAMGLQVGMVYDTRASDRLTAGRLDALRIHLGLGAHAVAMSREIGPGDLTAYRAVRRLALEHGAAILHGHGAKGGAYARLAAAALQRKGHAVCSLYTPHGGSLHYRPSSLQGRAFMTLERYLGSMTDGLIFESAYSERVYRAQVGPPSCPVRIIPNGLQPDEFSRHQPTEDAADIVFVGELRQLKGVDLLIEALAGLSRLRPVSALIVGDGPDRAAFEAAAANLGPGASVVFAGVMPAREAFARGRVLAMPSRAESFPYIVLEAAAAGIPLVASDVGGIPEIVAGTDTQLVPAGDASALARALAVALDDPAAAAARADRLQQAVAGSFSVDRMVNDVVEFYRQLTAR